MNEKEFDSNLLDDLPIDPRFDDLDVLFKTAFVKFSKYSKLYAYLVNEDVKVGMHIWIPGKDKSFEVLEVEDLKECDLPLPLEQMKYAYVRQPIDDKLNIILNNNKVLRKITKTVNLIGRDDVLEDLVVSINKKRMKNSILIGDAGCGKTTIVESFSEMISDNYITLGFNVGELISGTTLRGMLEEKITNIFKDILEFNTNNRIKIILFIDEFHMLVSNCGCTDAVSMHDIIKTYLTNPNMIVIGATTIKEYNSYIKRDVALMRRITPIYVNNLSDNSVVDILDEFSNHEVEEELLRVIVNETKKIPNTTNPDISLEVLDRVMAKHDILGYKIDLDFINNEISKLKQSFEIL